MEIKGWSFLHSCLKFSVVKNSVSRRFLKKGELVLYESPHWIEITSLSPSFLGGIPHNWAVSPVIAAAFSSLADRSAFPHPPPALSLSCLSLFCPYDINFHIKPLKK